ncbi:alpha/beta fold hydrolase [Jiulongibacter sediminis]|uniref:Alpha/beta hydrolase n=1 Tax=Jiulongibacter sediminis TaxID=1605367 RepID=A0A0P7BPD8_9BACT|nr:alpha/beta fold hydrolase [Jiulongibacter sediminis]KPM47137.1 alpha/beta hydrolase [Jiulongibacter sediminis]TBX22698.1 alpha/beta hydrolase [Jiulongibacter sediminis]
MNLYFRKLGDGKPLVILHGVFGSSDNLYTVSKKLAEKNLAVYTLDARNHGQSPQSDELTYEAMAADLDEFLTKEDIENPVIMGHSMGGKTVMQYAQHYNNFEKLIIVDIAPRFYPTHHDHIIAGLNAIPINEINNRKEAEEIFEEYVPSFAERQFILKNIYRTDDGNYAWRINVPVISENIHEVGSEIISDRLIEKPVLFIRGGESSYITDADFKSIQKGYPNAEMVTIEGANHWVHATKPTEFIKAVEDFVL